MEVVSTVVVFVVVGRAQQTRFKIFSQTKAFNLAILLMKIKIKIYKYINKTCKFLFFWERYWAISVIAQIFINNMAR